MHSFGESKITLGNWQFAISRECLLLPPDARALTTTQPDFLLPGNRLVSFSSQSFICDLRLPSAVDITANLTKARLPTKRITLATSTKYVSLLADKLGSRTSCEGSRVATVVLRILSAANQEAEVQRQAAKVAAVREYEDLIECAQQSVTGIWYQAAEDYAEDPRSRLLESFYAGSRTVQEAQLRTMLRKAHSVSLCLKYRYASHTVNSFHSLRSYHCSSHNKLIINAVLANSTATCRH